MTAEQLQAIVYKVNALSPPQRLRLAADLMEHQPYTALAIIRRVADELQLAIMLSEVPE